MLQHWPSVVFETHSVCEEDAFNTQMKGTTKCSTELTVYKFRTKRPGHDIISYHFILFKINVKLVVNRKKNVLCLRTCALTVGAHPYWAHNLCCYVMYRARLQCKTKLNDSSVGGRCNAMARI